MLVRGEGGGAKVRLVPLRSARAEDGPRAQHFAAAALPHAAVVRFRDPRRINCVDAVEDEQLPRRRGAQRLFGAQEEQRRVVRAEEAP